MCVGFLAKEPSPETLSQLSDMVNESNPDDIFSRESQFIRSNSVSRSSTLPRASSRSSTLNRNNKPGDIYTGGNHGTYTEDISPTHVSQLIVLQICRGIVLLLLLLLFFFKTSFPMYKYLQIPIGSPNLPCSLLQYVTTVIQYQVETRTCKAHCPAH